MTLLWRESCLITKFVIPHERHGTYLHYVLTKFGSRLKRLWLHSRTSCDTKKNYEKWYIDYIYTVEIALCINGFYIVFLEAFIFQNWWFVYVRSKPLAIFSLLGLNMKLCNRVEWNNFLFANAKDLWVNIKSQKL